MRKFIIFALFFVFIPYLSFAAPRNLDKVEEVRLIIQNSAGYPIPHLSITKIHEDPTVDLLDKPLKNEEAIDVFLNVNGRDVLVLWLMDENYSKLAIELQSPISEIERVIIQNNGAARMLMKDKDASEIRKQY